MRGVFQLQGFAGRGEEPAGFFVQPEGIAADRPIYRSQLHGFFNGAAAADGVRFGHIVYQQDALRAVYAPPNSKVMMEALMPCFSAV